MCCVRHKYDFKYEVARVGPLKFLKSSRRAKEGINTAKWHEQLLPLYDMHSVFSSLIFNDCSVIATRILLGWTISAIQIFAVALSCFALRVIGRDNTVMQKSKIIHSISI